MKQISSAIGSWIFLSGFKQKTTNTFRLSSNQQRALVKMKRFSSTRAHRVSLYKNQKQPSWPWRSLSPLKQNHVNHIVFHDKLSEALKPWYIHRLYMKDGHNHCDITRWFWFVLRAQNMWAVYECALFTRPKANDVQNIYNRRFLYLHLLRCIIRRKRNEENIKITLKLLN